MDCEILILGGGVSGLAAASRLSDRSVILLEGRERLGGRILTHRQADLDFPIELGAEFIHGEMESTFQLVRAGGLLVCDVSDRHERLRRGRPEPMENFWERLSGVLEKLDARRSPDRSIADFLKDETDLDPATRDLVRGFIEGFHAAPLEEASEAGIAIAEQDADEAHSFRLPGGYDQLVDTLLARVRPDSVRTGRTAKRLRWSRETGVEVTARTRTGEEIYRARRVLITLPIGVLQAPASTAGLVFDPEPDGLRDTLSGLRMGAAARFIFRFRHAIWEDVRKDIGFLHASSESPFPVWWTPLPLRQPVITAWAGGPRAIAAARRPLEESIALGLEALSEMTGIDRARFESELVGVEHHDWIHDPFSLGAYSFIAVDGVERARRFASPIENTLFFAGEATCMGFERGTVSGAIASGLRAAESLRRFSET